MGANPQIENGHTDIANELVEAFARLYLSAKESRVLWAILRKTYGWHRKFDHISFTQFEQLTGMKRRHIADALGRLIQRRIIIRRGNHRKLEYGINKNYDEWILLPVEVTNKVKHLQSLPIRVTKPFITHRGNTPLPIGVTKTLPIGVNTKTKKETIQKAIIDAGGSTFKDYENQLRQRFSDLDFDLELEKFWLYWNEGKRKLKNPKLALLNWMTKARQIKTRDGAENRAAQQKLNRTGMPGNRPAGAFADLAAREQPQNLRQLSTIEELEEWKR